ncbi:MAG: glutathione S-transferase family protein [Pseudomonadota bacterium]
MGLLIDGEWHDKWYDTKKSGGEFKRQDSAYRNWVTTDGAAGPSGEGGFEAESGRYHLYVSHACPWANRALLFRHLKGLEEHITLSVVHPFMGSDGWTFGDDWDGATGDTLLGKRFLREVYLEANPTMTGRVTVPVLWDKKRGTIVSNESSEIIRMFNSAFDGVTGNTLDFYPEALREEIGEVNARVYDTVNNGVYKSGFATTQEAYERAVVPLFETLDWLEDRLSTRRYLMGERMTEADWRLWTTLIRFDPVYVGHFKCNIRRIADYPALSGFTRELYQVPGVKERTRLDHIKYHYYASHDTVNPTRIVPVGPALDLDVPHGRDRLAAA